MSNLKLFLTTIIQSQQTHKRGKQTIAKVFSAAHCCWACQYCFTAAAVTAFLGQCAHSRIPRLCAIKRICAHIVCNCAIKLSLKCIEYQNHHEVWREVSFSVHWSEKVWENISEFQRDNFDTSSCDKENCVAVRLEGILTNFNQICFSAFTRESFKSVTYKFMNW